MVFDRFGPAPYLNELVKLDKKANIQNSDSESSNFHMSINEFNSMHGLVEKEILYLGESEPTGKMGLHVSFKTPAVDEVCVSVCV